MLILSKKISLYRCFLQLCIKDPDAIVRERWCQFVSKPIFLPSFCHSTPAPACRPGGTGRAQPPNTGCGLLQESARVSGWAGRGRERRPRDES